MIWDIIREDRFCRGGICRDQRVRWWGDYGKSGRGRLQGVQNHKKYRKRKRGLNRAWISNIAHKLRGYQIKKWH